MHSDLHVIHEVHDLSIFMFYLRKKYKNSYIWISGNFRLKNPILHPYYDFRSYVGRDWGYWGFSKIPNFTLLMNFCQFWQLVLFDIFLVTWWCTYEEGGGVEVSQDYFGEDFASDSYFENLYLMKCSCMVLRIGSWKILESAEIMHWYRYR